MTSQLTLSAINASTISQHYSNLYHSLSTPCDLTMAQGEHAISVALFFHLAKMKLAGWRHRVDFQRCRKHSMSDYFQDLVAFYLRCSLPPIFDISLEQTSMSTGGKKTQADILIRKNGKNHFVVEVKTTIGFARPIWSSPEPYKPFTDRISANARNFGVDERNVIFIFEEPLNVSRVFREHFWNQREAKPAPRGTLIDPLRQIFPLFWKDDPYYWSWPGATPVKKGLWCPEISDERIILEANSRIVTSFESVVNLIAA
jgi:hypothetical protein